ncbi:MAG: DUF5060 domain-containing protein [Chloroflexia bacterium]
MKLPRLIPLTLVVLVLLVSVQHSGFPANTGGVAAATSPLLGSADQPRSVPRYGIFEPTFNWSGHYRNPWEEVRVTMTLTSPAHVQVSVGGFYYAPGIWKARFAPAETGAWSWEAILTDGTHRAEAAGNFTVVDSDWPGFVRPNPTNRFRWVFDDGTSYNPLGIGDCIAKDLGRWGFDGDFRPPGRHEGWTTDIDTYMAAYSGAGVNLFRWSVDNCAFGLHQTIAPEGNVYLQEEGLSGDKLVQKLRKYHLRTYMTIFGFNPPFPHSTTPEQFAAIKRYVKYVVDRYGAYVDFWELMNEATVSDQWYTEIAQYLRSIDPYHHPISTSWQQPDLSAIDINSPHWYQKESEFDSDVVTWQNFNGWKGHNKPVIVGEQGNAEQNWDERSALRMRLRSWTAFFAEGVLIFWNASFAKDYRNPGAADIYLGPEERGYLRVLQGFTNNFDPQAVTAAVELNRPDLVRGYALSAPTTYAAYLHSYTNHRTATVGIKVTVELRAAGKARWIEPATGRVLGTACVGSGHQTLLVPDFVTDIALKVNPEDSQ